MSDSDMGGLIYPVTEISEIRQRRYGGKGSPILESGDCWATAVACFAGLNEKARNELHRRIVLSDIALERAGTKTNEGGGWWNVTQRFLRERAGKVIGTALTESIPPDGIWIASGPSPRGDWWHSILAYADGRLAWDPHPSDDGLEGIEEWAGWWTPAEEVAA